MSVTITIYFNFIIRIDYIIYNSQFWCHQFIQFLSVTICVN